ncbi:ferritin-like domain-containing protein [Brevundimonas sp. PAMC22021]|uniref:ferritin-like domain-containing protein n=1 Tax=Brevundimonas sp. PAMC22021 TaxID=2861285 RepID=UPI001C629E9B|nr:ferritin-like domain-containing protein [Brevundimonas sp. PAMC22021]QYF85943.1 ferritin-like domain-containing protein [Brevundimonas sp. PAMC22021]
MSKLDLLETLERRSEKQEERRRLFRLGGGFAVGAAAGAVLSACGSSAGDAVAQNPPATDNDPAVLNFALNLEYLEAQFYSFAAFGTGLADADLGGQGTRGAVTGGRAVNFTDPVVRAYAREIANDEIAHVRFLRSALGTSAVAQPAIDVGVGPNSAFSQAARAAGLISAGQTFDPYANDENFLLAAYIFEDVGVTAYKGASPLINSKTYLEAAAGILAAEAYHAGLVRTVLYSKGLATPSLRTGANAISDARDSLDGSSRLDQGITGDRGLPADTAASNIFPGDANAIAFSRTTGQVLNIVYLTAAVATGGGFFPSGVNGTINRSGA